MNQSSINTFTLPDDQLPVGGKCENVEVFITSHAHQAVPFLFP